MLVWGSHNSRVKAHKTVSMAAERRKSQNVPSKNPRLASDILEHMSHRLYSYTRKYVSSSQLRHNL